MDLRRMRKKSKGRKAAARLVVDASAGGDAPVVPASTPDGTPLSSTTAEPDAVEVRGGDRGDDPEARDAAAEELLLEARERTEIADVLVKAAERRAEVAEELIRTARERGEIADVMIRAAERRAEIADVREQAIDHRAEVVEARERSIAERDALANARDRAAAERDELQNQRDRAATERDALAMQRAGKDLVVDFDASDAELEKARLEAELQRAHLDALTGAYRREMGRLALRNEIDRARRGNGNFVVAFIDVDGLKGVNDREGHAAGDRILRTLVATMRANLRSYDPIVRFGGDEFILGISAIDPEEVRHRIGVIDQSLRSATGVGITAGLASLGNGDSLDELTARADAALIEAKANRNN